MLLLKHEWKLYPEEIPKNDEMKIITICDESGDYPYTYSYVGWYLKEADGWIVDNELRKDIIAWMPLPFPYNNRKKNTSFNEGLTGNSKARRVDAE